MGDGLVYERHICGGLMIVLVVLALDRTLRGAFCGSRSTLGDGNEEALSSV